MPIANLNIGKVKFLFVFRHKFEKDMSRYDQIITWRDYKLGFWYRRSKIVGEKDFNTPSKWKLNLVNSHMIGINLLVCKAWITISKGGMTLNITE